MGKLTTTILRRPIATMPSPTTTPTTSTSPTGFPLPPRPSRLLPKAQTRHATYVRRPRMPYKFTQLVQLSDGSTFTVRTMSPVGMYKSDKDSRNHVLWQPSNKALRNVEVDEAGKLAAFRERFGRAFDLRSQLAEEAEAEGKPDKAAEAVAQSNDRFDAFDAMEDLITGYSVDEPRSGGLNAKALAKLERKKK